MKNINLVLLAFTASASKRECVYIFCDYDLTRENICSHCFWFVSCKKLSWVKLSWIRVVVSCLDCFAISLLLVTFHLFLVALFANFSQWWSQLFPSLTVTTASLFWKYFLAWSWCIFLLETCKELHTMLFQWFGLDACGAELGTSYSSDFGLIE